ncbi:MAG: prolyl aminopeptidase, partial [Pseudomonadales bacterium]
MLPLYPEIKPYARHRLQVDDLHELYLDESGTPDGIPIVFVHSGPGSGCEFNSRCFFNPAKYRIILFDQRGAGRSSPHMELQDNTTAHLIGDLEKIREFLGIGRWIVFGGGWGSTLALAYAQAYPVSVLGLIARGVFLGRREDISWYCEEGANRFFPDHWEEFIRPVQTRRIETGKDLTCLEAYGELMDGDNELVRMASAKAWSVWEAHCSSLHPHPRLLQHFSAGPRALARCKIGTHYFQQDCFLEPNQLLDNAGQLDRIPGIIVHGRFDCVSPLDNAYLLRRAWPSAQLYIVREAGHTV